MHRKVVKRLEQQSFKQQDSTETGQNGHPTSSILNKYDTGSMSSSRRRGEKGKTATQEDMALDSIAQQSERLLAEKKKEREKARRMRMDEVNKRQQEDEEQLDRQYELIQRTGGPTATRAYPSQNSYSSRRSSIDSTDGSESKDLRAQFSELQEKYRKAMVSNAQLDNEKQGQSYGIELLKDRIEEMEEHMKELALEAKEKSRALDREKREYKSLENDVVKLKYLLDQRDNLIQQSGLVLMTAEESENAEVPEFQRNGSRPRNGSSSSESESRVAGGIMGGVITGPLGPLGEVEEEPSAFPVHSALVTADTAEKLKIIPGAALEHKISHLITENSKLKTEMKTLRVEMEEEREKASNQTPSRAGQPVNGQEAELQLLEYQRETSRIIAEYKLRVQKADNDTAALESNVQRLESQSRRLKDMMEAAEQTEEELKAEKRKLQRELREALAAKEEAENQRGHLQNRLDKIRQARREVLGQ